MKRIADQLKIKYDWYVCITRGGMQPCLDLAEITNQTNIDTLCITSYDWHTEEHKKKYLNAKYTHKNIDHLNNKKVLLIDDIVDSGDTLKCATNYITTFAFPKALTTVAVYVKPCAIFIPDFYIERLTCNDHVIFPWELNRSIT